MKRKDRELQNRMTLAIASYCRSFLYYRNFITESENDKVHVRIKKFQDKNKINISEEQINSVDITYSDI